MHANALLQEEQDEHDGLLAKVPPAARAQMAFAALDAKDAAPGQN